MRSRTIALVLVAITVVASATLLLRPDHSTAQTLWGDADAEPAPFNPQMAALMSMLIQPRHAKLGLAGKAENWPMAGYMFKELRQSFAVTARAVPRWKNSAMRPSEVSLGTKASGRRSRPWMPLAWHMIS